MIKNFRKGLKLNIKPWEAVIRVLVAFALTSLVMFFQSTIAIILICGFVTYLLVTSLLLYCPLKSLMQHGVTEKKQMTRDEKQMPYKEL